MKIQKKLKLSFKTYASQILFDIITSFHFWQFPLFQASISFYLPPYKYDLQRNNKKRETIKL